MTSPKKGFMMVLCRLRDYISSSLFRLVIVMWQAFYFSFFLTFGSSPKPSAEKMQEVKRPATATTSKASEPVKTNVIKERPLSSGASDRKATQPTQTVHRQNVEKVVSQETRQNYTKDRRIKVQQTQTVQKNQQTTEKKRNLVTKKGQKKK